MFKEGDYLKLSSEKETGLLIQYGTVLKNYTKDGCIIIRLDEEFCEEL